MTRFSASALDLSRISRSALWPERSFADIELARIADLKARFAAAGIPFDVEQLETDPSRYLQQSSAYRELLTLYAIDDAQASVLLAFAIGAYLDKLGDLHVTPRLEGESDDRYRARIQLAPEAFAAAGTPGGYIYHATQISTDVRDVGLTVLDRGKPSVMVELVILSATGNGAPSAALVQAVRDRVTRDDIKLLTDTVVVRGAVIVEYDVVATQYIRPGPDPNLVRTLGVDALRKAADRQKRIGGDVPRNALDAALYVANVDRVEVQSPSADIITQRHQAAHLRDVTLKTVIVND